MKKKDYIIENGKLFTLFDEMHQKMLKGLEKNCSIWFMNILMKTLLKHKCRDTMGDGLSEDDLKVLTHADQSIILGYLSLNLITLMDPRAEEALKKEKCYFKQIHCGDQLDSLLLVLYNLQEMDWKEFRHHSPVINEGDYTQEELN